MTDFIHIVCIETYLTIINAPNNNAEQPFTWKNASDNTINHNNGLLFVFNVG